MTLLLEHGASLDCLRFGGVEAVWSVYGKFGRGTALHRAVALNRLDVAAMLLQHGADPGIEDTRGNTAEQVARKAGHESAITLLSTATRQC
jgi:hypothetical protein